MQDYGSGFPITPDNAAELPTVTDALWIGGAGGGGLKVTMEDGKDLTLASVPTGELRLRVRRVYATGTTVTAIQGLKR